MDRLQLATLLSWASPGGLQGRKRLQKVVFFLQHAGCDLDCRFTLHHYGPYSRDVADACDEIVAAGLVDETGGPPSGLMQYSYALKPHTTRYLEEAPDSHLQRFEDLGKELIGHEVWTLELGSTILFYYGETDCWDQALSQACEFKSVSANDEPSQKALKLAKYVDEQRRVLAA